MNWFTIYLLTRFDAIHEAMIPLFIFSVIVFAGASILLFPAIDCKIDEQQITMLKRFKIGGLICFILFGTIHLITPTNKDLAIIIAGNWAVNSSEVQKLPDNVVKTMNKFMSEYIDDKKEK